VDTVIQSGVEVSVAHGVKTWLSDLYYIPEEMVEMNGVQSPE
jgi:hypothetical protein